MQIPILFFLLICGVLSVKGSPVEIEEVKSSAKHVSAEAKDLPSKVVAESAAKDLPSKVVSESAANKLPSKARPASVESLDSNSSSSESVEVVEASPASEGRPVVQASVVIHATSIFQSVPNVLDSTRKMGPVELGLRNVVAASAAATEELYYDMTALNAETSHMINSKSEILTANAMNELFEPLNKVENEIKKSEECGKGYETALNMIFKDIDVSLKECSKNLTAIDGQYKNENIGSLTALSIAADEMSNLPESCEISENFAVGTFCVVNNLAEMNERVLGDVKLIKKNTISAEEEAVKAIKTSEICQKKLVERTTEKLTKLSKDVNEKCILRKP